jgi:uncharacterized protein YbjQ (UPF0145 family)
MGVVTTPLQKLQKRCTHYAASRICSMNSNVDFKSELMGGVTEVLCYGTAVVVSPKK